MDKPDKAEFKKELVLFFIAALFFVATFVLGALLKFSLMEQLFAGAASLTPSTLVEGQEAAPYEPSNAEICMVCIQSCVQFATSLFLFALGMQKSLKQQREDAKETLILRATENRLHIDSEIAELVRAGEFDLDALEIQKLEQTKEHIDREASLQKTVARKVLAQSLKNKEASTYLLEE